MPGRRKAERAACSFTRHSLGPTLAPKRPGPNQDRAGAQVCASRGSTYFVTGALGFVVAAGRLSLAGWRRHRSPEAGAASPVPQLQHLPLPRGRGGLLQRPETRAAHGVSLAGCSATHQPRTRRPAEPRPLTRPHHGGAAAAPGHPQNGINERALEGRRTSARGRGRLGVRGRLGAPGPSREGGDEAEHGRRLPGARLHAEAQVGGEEGAGREGGSVTRFSASPGARRLSRSTPCPASGLRSRLVPAPLHLSLGSCLPQPGHAPQAPPRPAPLRCTAVPTAPPPSRRGDVTSPPGSTPVSARTQVGALRKGGSGAGWRKGRSGAVEEGRVRWLAVKWRTCRLVPAQPRGLEELPENAWYILTALCTTPFR